MKTKKVLMALTTVILGLLATSCTEPLTLKHYVDSYVLEVEDGKDGYDVVENDEGLILVRLRSTKSVRWYLSKDEERSKYLEFARKHNDLSWNKKVMQHDGTHLKAVNFTFTANQVVDITVTAESDWGTDIAVGSSLDDQFIFVSASPDQFLRNGYKLDKERVDEIINQASPRLQNSLNFFCSETLFTMLPIIDTLSKVNFENYQLLGFGKPWFALMPVDKLIPGAKLKINVKFDNGKEVSYYHTCK